MTLKTVTIEKTHNRRKFDCGEPPLNTFLRNIARQSSDRRATRSYILIEDEIDPTEILGYYTLVPSSIDLPDEHPLKKRYTADPPVVRLARLAVDKQYQGEGLAKYLLVDALIKVVQASDSIGGIGCAVDAKNSGVKRFYEKFGFVEIDHLNGESLALWLPIEQCRKVVEIALGDPG